MAFKLCDSCKSATANLFCRADSAFLCLTCDSKIHAANKLASRHARVWICEVCEQAPAHVTCKADAAALCITCDRDIHSANPLARRHDRVPVTPFHKSPNSVNSSAVKSCPASNFFQHQYFSDEDGDADVSREEAEAASWLLPNPNPKASESPDLNSDQFMYPEIDPCLDLEFMHRKLEAQEQNSSGTDGVVPVRNKTSQISATNYDNCFGTDFSGSKSFAFGYNTPCLSHNVSSPSLEVGVVPDENALTDISDPRNKSTNQAFQISAADRRARVLRYREKRKNRKFEKTIRYASRKAYAETRPRIKGRFAKRSDSELDHVERVSRFGVVPTF